MTIDPMFQMSAHAKQRGQQRAVPEPVSALLLQHADIEVPARSGCLMLSLSRSTAQELIANGCEFATVECAEKTVLIVGRDGTVVTQWKADERRRRRKASNWRAGERRRRREASKRRAFR